MYHSMELARELIAAGRLDGVEIDHPRNTEEDLSLIHIYSKHPPFLISWILGTILGLISRKGIVISKNSPFSAKN